MPCEPPRKIRVLVVDDSPTIRQTLKQVLESDPGIEVLAAAPDPYVAVRQMREAAPDVITLDIEMPRMDGLTFLEKIMAQHPIPVVVCSSLTEAGSPSALAALDLGAVDIITKPKLGTKEFLEESRLTICEVVKAASRSRVQVLRDRLGARVAPKLTADEILAKASPRAMVQTTEKVVVVGASTGGTEALQVLLSALPVDGPGVVVVQHMPEGFTAQFARRLDSLCRIHVKEAASGESVLPGQALIARGGTHLLLKRSGARYYVELKDGPLVSRHRPSVDVLFRSTARYAGKNALGVILTGMGDDGARGMREMRDAGAFNIAQDEATCVVYGMPHEAVKQGAVDRTLPLERIADEILRKCRS
jgi:two-component system, chemotaxis family, protein-glutamate methylesterase/glutaminase